MWPLKSLKDKDPLKYAKKIGVKCGKNVDVNATIFWGSEPYLISIGDNTRFSFYVKFINHDGAVSVIRNLKNRPDIDLIKPIKIGNNCFIGLGATILYGVTIGDNVIVGTGSVVTKDLESNYVYAGVPAKKICSIDEFEQKNEDCFLNTKQMSPDEKREYLINYFNNKENK